ncbi:MAG: hypothetical protein JXX14_26115 [Deltaproteobacteria bacterium]|nr:hypothetical protein [Deltaproteobacteria bacterium]
MKNHFIHTGILLLLPLLCGPGCGYSTQSGDEYTDTGDSDSWTDSDSISPDTVAHGINETVTASGAILNYMRTDSQSLTHLFVDDSNDLLAFNHFETLQLSSDAWNESALLLDAQVDQLCRRPDGRLWGLSSQNTLKSGTLENLESEFVIPEDSDRYTPIVQDIWCADDGSVYLVGSYAFLGMDVSPNYKAVFARFDGGQLVNYAPEIGVQMNAVWSDGDAVVAVGDKGTVMVLRDGVITTSQMDTQADLLAINGRSATDVYVGTSIGTVLHFNGDSWESVLLPDVESRFVYDIEVTPELVFISCGLNPAAHLYSGVNSAVYMLGGGEAMLLEPQPNGTIVDMMWRDNVLWGVGYREGAYIARFVDSTWEEMYHRPSLGAIDQVAVNAKGEAIAVGLRVIAASDGRTWHVINLEDYNHTDAVPFDDTRFIVSHRNYDGTTSPLLMVDGTDVSPVIAFDSFDAHLNGLAACEDGGIWAVGHWGACSGESAVPCAALAVHWDGSTWTERSPSLAVPLFSVDCSSTMAVVSSGAQVLIFENGEWRGVFTSPDNDLGPVGVADVAGVYDVFIGRSPVSVWNGSAVYEEDALDGIRAFDFAGAESGVLLMAGDRGLSYRGDDGAVLMMRQGSQWENVVANDNIVFGSVDVSGNRIVALDRRYVWWGTL